MMNVVGNATVDSYVFFFNDAATTETYTYVHTLPLHDALPIFTRRRHEARRGTGSAPPAGAGGARRDSGGVSAVAAGAAPGRGHGSRHRADRRRLRSEEHTSELQSLMRISYAVFCLKKKKH